MQHECAFCYLPTFYQRLAEILPVFSAKPVPIRSLRCYQILCALCLQYSEWGPCSVECGTGSQERTVSCNEHGGCIPNSCSWPLSRRCVSIAACPTCSNSTYANGKDSLTSTCCFCTRADMLAQVFNIRSGPYYLHSTILPPHSHPTSTDIAGGN